MTPTPAVNDSINPHFTYLSTIHFDELDPMQILHNSRFAAHVERAITAWFTSRGGRWESDVSRNPDQFHVVRELRIEFLSPATAGPMRIDIWVERIGETSCAYGFLCSSEDGSVAFARGERAIVKLDPATRKPARWTEYFRAAHRDLLRDLRAYA